MGLPVWRAPSPTDSKDAIKVDLSASARSPIRRRVRGSPVVGGRRAAAAAPRRSGNAHATLAGTQRSRRLNDFLESSLAERRADNSRDYHDSRLLSDARPLFPPPPVPESRNYARDTMFSRDYARESLGFTRNRDEPAGRAHPLRRPSDRHASTASSRVTSESGPRSFGLFGYHLPALRGSSMMGSSRPYPLPFTPNFAPADYAAAQGSTQADFHEDREPSPDHRTESQRPAGRGLSPHREPSRPSRSRNILILDDLEDDGSSSDNNAVGFPPLRRMGRRAIADGPLPLSSLRESWSPATTLDGLGDRERSFSPIEDHWDTMLSTVAPDPVAPTADSSFTSAAASASFSNSHPSSRSGSANSNSVASSRTHLTVPSRRHSGDELFVRVCDTSEDDSPSDTEVEEDTSHVHARRPMPWRRTPLPTDEPPSRNVSRYSRNVRDQSLDSSRFVRNFYSFARSAAEDHPLSNEENARNEGPEAPSLDPELREARAILERLSRRDDISDEFWASVGLTPPLAERVERIHQRERL